MARRPRDIDGRGLQRHFPRWTTCPVCGSPRWATERNKRHDGKAGGAVYRRCLASGCDNIYLVLPAVIEDRGPDGRSRYTVLGMPTL